MSRLDNAVESREQCAVCPLSRVQAGMAVRIKQLCAAPHVQLRLRELGFCEEQVVRLLTGRNNLICQVCNARFAISEQLARLILVQPLQPAYQEATYPAVSETLWTAPLALRNR